VNASSSVPPESDAKAALSPLPKALFLALLVFGLSEQLIWSYRPWLEFCDRYARPGSVSDPLRTTARIRLLPKDEPVPPILLIGSSQILEGLACPPFEARWPGRTCRNLAIAGGNPLDVLFLTDRIDQRVQRRVLITGLFPDTLHRSPKAAFSNVDTARCVLTSGAWLGMTSEDWIKFVFGQLQNLSETLRVKDALWDMWDVVKENPRAALRFELPPQPPRRLTRMPRHDPEFFERMIGVKDPNVVLGPYTATHETALEELIRREAARGNTLVLIDFPTRRGHETMISPEAFTHHRQLIERLAARSDVVVVQSHDLPPLEDEDFHDFTHVNANGRRKLSPRIAEILARVEEGGR
jgi:hypothetical protein